MTADLKPLIAKAASGQPLSFEEACAAFDVIMQGEATPSQIGGLLMAMRVRGETVEEVAAGAFTLRAKMTPIQAPADAIDIVGTGGDASGTHNISTASAFVAAGAGLTIAKHGNRGLSSKSGAADVLTSLGVDIEAPFAAIESAIQEAGLGFMMAPRHHGAMRHVGPTRVELGTRTIFNLLGPLANPASVKRQLTGVFAPEWVEPVCAALGRLGAERAWVVHGHSGLDEISTTGPTQVAEWDGKSVKTFEISPADIGVATVTLEQLKGGTPAQNAQAVLDMLDGAQGPLRDIVTFTAAAALVVAGKVETLAQGADRARTAIDSGAARQVLDKLVAITNTQGDGA